MNWDSNELTWPEVIGNIGEKFAVKKLTKQGFLLTRAEKLISAGISLLDKEFSEKFDCDNLFLLTQRCWEWTFCNVFKEINSRSKKIWETDKIGRLQYFSKQKTKKNQELNKKISNIESKIKELNSDKEAIKLKKEVIKFKQKIKENELNLDKINKRIEIVSQSNFDPAIHKFIKKRPCRDPKSDFFTHNYKHINILAAYDTICFQGYCSFKLSWAALNGACKECKSKCFIKSYMMVDRFIENYWVENNKKLNDYDNAVWKGHPGRIDFFGLKNDEYFTIEVKTNTGRLGRWQAIRLYCIQEFGFKSFIFRINLKDLDKVNVTKLYNEKKYDDIFNSYLSDWSIEEFDISNFSKYKNNMPAKEEVNRLCKRTRWVEVSEYKKD